MRRFVVIDTVRCAFLGVAQEKHKADAIARLLSSGNDTFCAGDEPHWYYIFDPVQLYRLYKNTTYAKPAQGWTFEQLAEKVAELGAALESDACTADELAQRHTSSLQIANEPVNYAPSVPQPKLPVKKGKVKPLKPKLPVKKKLSLEAQRRLVSRCGLIHPEKYPQEGSISNRIWKIADKITAENGELPTSAEVLAACAKEGILASTTRNKLSRWRKAHPAYKKRIW